jgi:hypothetical protein
MQEFEASVAQNKEYAAYSAFTAVLAHVSVCIIIYAVSTLCGTMKNGGGEPENDGNSAQKNRNLNTQPSGMDVACAGRLVPV